MKSKKLKTIFLASACVISAVAMPCIFLTGCLHGKIMDGISIDRLNVSEMTREDALSAATQNAEEMMKQTMLTLLYESRRWSFSFSELGACFLVEESVQKAMDAGNEHGLFASISGRRDIKEHGLDICSEISINEDMLEGILGKIKSEIDTPVVQPVIDFDPSEYNYFNETMNPRSMFEITEGMQGCELDVTEAASVICQAISSLQSTKTALPVNEILPGYSGEELESMTSLVCHSSCHISSAQRYDDSRNHNIIKALKCFKGLVVMPGEAVSFFAVIGEPSYENGWLTPPVIARDRVLFDSFNGISQAATTIFNAAFRAGAEIIERHTHNYTAYYQDFGYGMDAYVKYGEKDLIFKNTSGYPMFFDAYFCYDSKGRPSYADVDVYTMPPGENMYITTESIIEETISPPPAEYIELGPDEFNYLNWTEDEQTGMLTAQYQKPGDGYVVRIYKVLYENGSQSAPGVWEGGEPALKGEFALVEYPSVQEIIYTKPILPE